MSDARVPRRRSGSGRRVAAAVALAAALGACTSEWALRTAAPRAALQWPYAPAPAKLTYVRSLAGFDQAASARSVLAAVVYGAASKDSNAFVLPVAVATGEDGRIAVADTGRRCVHLYVPAERRYLRLTGSAQKRMQSPVGVAFDEQSRLYVADSAGRLFAFDRQGVLRFAIDKAGERPLQRPTGLAYSPQRGWLYVVDTLAQAIYAFDAQGALALTIGQRGEGPGSFNFPTHIAWAPPGELYVTDTFNFRIQILDERGKYLGSFGHHGDGSGDLAMPKGVAVDKDGVVYVADGLLDNVQLFDRQGRFLLTLGRRGVDFGEFWLPTGMFLDRHDDLYVCDTYNRRVQVFHVAERYAQPTP